MAAALATRPQHACACTHVRTRALSAREQTKTLAHSAPRCAHGGEGGVLGRGVPVSSSTPELGDGGEGGGVLRGRAPTKGEEGWAESAVWCME